MKTGDSFSYKGFELVKNGKSLGEITQYDNKTGTFTFKEYSWWRRFMRITLKFWYWLKHISTRRVEDIELKRWLKNMKRINEVKK
jgi:hypothetical protein